MLLQLPRSAYLHAANAWYVARGYWPKIRRQRRRQRSLYREFIAPDDVCFDIGANIGDRTRAFLDVGARVVAVDPQPSSIERLRFAFRNNRRVIVVPEAVGAESGQGELAICDAAPTISTMSRSFREAGRFATDYRWNRTVSVPVTTLDTLIARFGAPAFCKIDVEGFELEVLRGLSRSLPSLSFEFGWDSLDQTVACLEHLSALGQLSANYSVGETMVWALPKWVQSDVLVNTSASWRHQSA